MSLYAIQIQTHSKQTDCYITINFMGAMSFLSSLVGGSLCHLKFKPQLKPPFTRGDGV